MDQTAIWPSLNRLFADSSSNPSLPPAFPLQRPFPGKVGPFFPEIFHARNLFKQSDEPRSEMEVEERLQQNYDAKSV